MAVVNKYDNGVPNGKLDIHTSSMNAKEIRNAINDTLLYLKTNTNLPDQMKISRNANVKVMATPKSMFDFFGKNEPVDLMTMSEDQLKNLTLEPKIDVYFSQVGGRKSRRRKSRKNKRS